ncbi:MAG: chemotaxis protein CheA [Oxalobacter formigenes]|nr:chemotaxis protein CheA [Oxalobacter formigenes]
MNIDMNQFYQVFFDETEELLAEKERLLLGIDLDNPDAEDIDAIFRAAHSIKGGAATFGLTDIAEVTHVMESLLDEIRKGHMKLTSEHVEVFLMAKDVLKMLRDGHQYGTEVDQASVKEVMGRLEALAHAHNEATGGGDKSKKGKPGSGEGQVLYEIALPAMEAEQLEALVGELGTLGELKRETGADGQTVVRLSSAKKRDDILSLCSFVLNPDEVAITEKPLDEEEDNRSDDERGYGFFDNISLPYRREDNEEAVKADEEAQRKAGNRGEAAKKASRSASAGSTSIRVGVDKVDQLINLVGELVITQAMIEQQASSLDPMVYQRLLDSVSQLSRNSRDLQQAVMSMRMMPMEYVFSRFPRMVHDLAGKLGKKVELVTSGAATELDKGLIERIIDPLTHLVRNSVDHGIETPDVRIANGKSEVGKIFLSASHQGGNIVIEVNDDGAGLNREKILAKAQENGLPVSDNMPDSEVWNLIFAPGFSTAEVVTDVSGRGVGMDVVKRNITEMGGFVDIRSAHGMGTMLSVYLPLTLAILDGMSIRSGEEIYILPLGHVVESLQPSENDIKEISGRGKVIKVRGDYLALISLADVFNIEPRAKKPSEGIVVILEADGNRAALLVDELVGQQQVVVKNLETNYRKVPNVSGATIMGDGEVALIVDVSGLLRANVLNSDIGGF